MSGSNLKSQSSPSQKSIIQHRFGQLMSNSNSKSTTASHSYAAPSQPRNFKPGRVSWADRTASDLTAEAKNFKSAMDKLEANFYNTKIFYVMSSKWLQRWKINSKYQSVVEGKNSGAPMDEPRQLPIINQDIVDFDTPIDIQMPDQYSYLNVSLKKDLKEQESYLLVDKAVWDIFEPYDRIEIKRFMEKTPDGNKVEVHYKRMDVIILYNDLLKSVEYERVTKFKRTRVQLPQYRVLDETLLTAFADRVKSFVKTTLSRQYYRYTYGSDLVFSEGLIKFWKIHDDLSQPKFVDHLHKGCKGCRSLSYRMHFPGVYVDVVKQALVASDLSPTSIIVLELKEYKEDWIFFTKEHLISARCENCKEVKKLCVMCSCKDAAYCSRQCKQSDKAIHRNRCQRNAESSEEQPEKTFNSSSKRGQMGLKNLGNTCFMNSGIQCLSSVRELTDYFLSGEYLKEINKTNPLGTKGELSCSYGKLLTKMWYDSDSSTAPAAVKRAIGRFQPMFSGYDQHDSGQLISYMLDGLHEDLNRVIQKPYVETKDYDGRPDDIIARQSWENFLKRNRSQVVDLMYGQYRSKLDCPECKKVSIIFDPFMIVPLPIPQDSRDPLTIRYFKSPIISYNINTFFERDMKLETYLNDLAPKLPDNPDPSKLLVYEPSYSSCRFYDTKQDMYDFRSSRDITVRKAEQFEELPDGMRINVKFTQLTTYSYSQSKERRSFGQITTYFLKKQTTALQIHEILFKQYGELIDAKDYAKEVVGLENIKQRPIVIYLVHPGYYGSDCVYCKTKDCKGCQLPYSNTVTLAKLTETAKSYRPSEIVEIEFYFQKEPEKAVRALEYPLKLAAGGSANITIDDCFNLMQQPETLDQNNEWFCPQCKNLVRAKKQLSIYKAPKILILNLKRFKAKGYKGLFKSKLQAMVRFPLDSLDIGKYVINHDLPSGMASKEAEKMEVEGQKKPLMYDLFAISNHFGSLGGGHYTAYCKKNNQWMEYDDSSVSTVHQDHLCAPSSYVLFYRRRE